MRTCWLEESHIVGYHDDFVMSEVMHPMQALAELIRECGWEYLRLGVEMENYYYSARAHQVLAASVNPARPAWIADATGLVDDPDAAHACFAEFHPRENARHAPTDDQDVGLAGHGLAVLVRSEGVPTVAREMRLAAEIADLRPPLDEPLVALFEVLRAD